MFGRAAGAVDVNWPHAPGRSALEACPRACGQCSPGEWADAHAHIRELKFYEPTGLDQNYLYLNDAPLYAMGCTDREASIVSQQCSRNVPTPGTYKCLCMPSFLGDECQIATNTCETRTVPCGVHRECVFTAETAAYDGGQACPCINGTAEVLDMCTDVDECNSSPCQNAETCTDSTETHEVSLDAYVCACPVGYDVENCAEEVDLCSSAEAHVCGSHADCAYHPGAIPETALGNISLGSSGSGSGSGSWEMDMEVPGVQRSSLHTCTCQTGYAKHEEPLEVYLGEELPSYTAGKQYCEMRDMDLCSRDDYCPAGPGSAPYGGRLPGLDWAPVSDGFNEWVLLGASPTGGVTDSCKLHHEIQSQGVYGLPPWAEGGVVSPSNNSVGWVMCCPRSTACYEVDECSAHPCQNGGSCADSSTANLQAELPLAGLQSWYHPDGWDAEHFLWRDFGPNRFNATVTGEVSLVRAEIGHGATAPVTYLMGGTATSIDFGPIVTHNNFTVCSVSRYAGPARGTVLTASPHWLHGHSAGAAGVLQYGNEDNSNQSASSLAAPSPDDWLVMCGQTGLVESSPRQEPWYAQQVFTGEPRLTAAIPMDNPYCSCKLTRVRIALQ